VWFRTPKRDFLVVLAYRVKKIFHKVESWLNENEIRRFDINVINVRGMLIKMWYLITNTRLGLRLFFCLSVALDRLEKLPWFPKMKFKRDKLTPSSFCPSLNLFGVEKSDCFQVYVKMLVTFDESTMRDDSISTLKSSIHSPSLPTNFHHPPISKLFFSLLSAANNLG